VGEAAAPGLRPVYHPGHDAVAAMNEDFRDLLFAMLDAGARFLVVGAHALAVHGVPRATGDLDLWIEPTQDNAGRVVAALEQFGAPLASLRLSPSYDLGDLEALVGFHPGE